MNHQGREDHEGRFVTDGTAPIIDAALKVHRILGPGLLESSYEQCLAYELHQRGVAVQRQVPLPIIYDGLHFEAGYRIDLLVQNRVIVEIKAVETLSRLHHAQLPTYLKLSGCRIGLLINFNVVLLKNGLKRLVR